MRRVYIALTLVLLFGILTVTAAVDTAVSTAGSAARPVLTAPSDFTANLRSQTPDQSIIVQAPPTSPTGTLSTVFLPLVADDHGGPAACSPQSPFSLQIAALHQVTPDLGQVYGANTLAEAEWLARYDEAFPSLVQALAESGACWARFRVDWAWIQPDPPPADYVWGPYHDEKLGLLAETGVQLIAHVDAVPEWAGPAPQGPIDADHLDEFTQFLTDLVNRYKEPPYSIHHWELFNEPDRTVPRGGTKGWGLNGSQYAQMLAVAYPTIKAADPEATVLMGGLAHDWFTEHGGYFYRYFPDDIMLDAAADNFDVVNFHYFPDYHAEWERWVPEGDPPTCGIVDDGQGTPYEAWGIDLIAKTNHIRSRLRTCFDVDKPIWVTELGEHGRAGDEDSLAQQARYVIQGYARGLAAGVEKITWFALVSPPYDPFEQGLLYADDWSPKPAFYTYQTLTYELAGYTYAHTLDASGVEGYVFHDTHGREKTVAWWAQDWPQPTGSLVFASASRLRVVDREGNATIVVDGGPGDADGAQNGAVKLPLTTSPIFVSQ